MSCKAERANFTGPALCAIRPEDVTLMSCSDMNKDTWTVSNKLYKGAHHLYSVEKDSQRLTVQTHASEVYPLGSSVLLKIHRRLFLPLSD
jgi:predicted RNA binding protein YcfA (HicA-like mRNA interferase family)